MGRAIPSKKNAKQEGLEITKGGRFAGRLPVEIVERKGLGHPDSLADGMAEAVSRALCREYLKKHGVILHHNTDKLQVAGGRSTPFFGGGKITKPIYVLLSGRATEIDNLHETAKKAAREYLQETIRNLSVATDVLIDSRIGFGSAELSKTFQRRMANDTSCGVGFAPYTELERILLESEQLLNSPSFKKKNPQTGEDIKIMGVRNADSIDLTVATAMVSKHVNSMREYQQAKETIKSSVQELAEKISGKKVSVSVNAADENESIYLTVSGTSAEMGDDGSAGRGNRANGLITPYRPMTMESTSGKNPVTHVGKIYNILAGKMAEDISKVSGIEYANVYLVSKIGAPIGRPQIINVELGAKKPEEFQKEISEICAGWLGKLEEITEMFVKGELKTF